MPMKKKKRHVESNILFYIGNDFVLKTFFALNQIVYPSLLRIIKQT